MRSAGWKKGEAKKILLGMQIPKRFRNPRTDLTRTNYVIYYIKLSAARMFLRVSLLRCDKKRTKHRRSREHDGTKIFCPLGR
jgi:hypothetical protein